MNHRHLVQIVCALAFASASMWAQKPVISAGGVLNSSSQIPQALPNGSVAPGSIIVVYLDNVLQGLPTGQITAYPILTTFNNVSMSVTVGSTTVSALIFGTGTFNTGTVSGSFVQAIVPSTTPPGTGTITVSYSGQASATAPITVV